MTDQIVTGVFTLLGVAIGLFGERWVRTWGKVRCDLRWLAWERVKSADSPEGYNKVRQRRLEVTFLNRKDVPVTVWDMQVTFYRGDKPLDAKERPSVEFERERDGTGRFERATLPPRIHVSRTVVVSLGHDAAHGRPQAVEAAHRRQQAVEEADRIEFTAEIEGAGNLSARLASWATLEPQERRIDSSRFSIHPTSGN